MLGHECLPDGVRVTADSATGISSRAGRSTVLAGYVTYALSIGDCRDGAVLFLVLLERI